MLKGLKKVIHEDNVQLSRLYLAWHSEKGYGKDDAALDILSDILAGSKNSRLHKLLVHDLQIAQDVSAFQYSAKYNGIFFIITTAQPGVEINTLKEKILEIINELSEVGCTDKEIERALNGYKSSFIYSLQNLDNMTNQINSYNCLLNEPNSFNYDLRRYNNLNKDDIKNVTKEYLLKNYVELNIIPQKTK